MRVPRFTWVGGAAIAVVALATACATDSEPADVQTMSGGGRVGALMVCDEATFDSDHGACREDLREDPIESKAVYCSVEYADANGEPFTGEMSYGGDRIWDTGGTVDRENGSLWVRTGGSAKVPAGDWSCRLTVGERELETTFQTGGTTKAIVISGAACATADLRAGECPEGTESESFSNVAAVSCSSTLIGHLQGKAVRGRVLFEDETMSNFETPGTDSVTIAAVTLNADRLGIPVLPVGQYDCWYTAPGLDYWDVLYEVTR